MTRLDYNSTLYSLDAEGRIVSTCVGHVDPDGFVLRSNSIQFTGLEDTRGYHDRFLASRFSTVADTVYVSGTRGYARALSLDRPRTREDLPGARPLVETVAQLAARVQDEDELEKGR